LFHVDDGGDDFTAGTLRAGLPLAGGREQQTIFPVHQRAMEAEERGRLQDNRGPHQSARAHEQRADAGDHALAKPEARRARPGAIEDQQLLLEEQRFGHDGTHPARTGEPGDGRHEVKNQDAQIAHRTIVKQSSEVAEMLQNCGFAIDRFNTALSLLPDLSRLAERTPSSSAVMIVSTQTFGCHGRTSGDPAARTTFYTTNPGYFGRRRTQSNSHARAEPCLDLRVQASLGILAITKDDNECVRFFGERELSAPRFVDSRYDDEQLLGSPSRIETPERPRVGLNRTGAAISRADPGAAQFADSLILFA
jgi:hypothetical protein